MEPVGDVDRGRGAEPDGFGIRGRPVAADDLHPRVVGQPGGHGLDGAVGQQIDCAAGLDVDQDRGVDVALAQGELVDAQHARHRVSRIRQGAYQPQERGSAHRDGEGLGQAGTGPAGQGQGELLQRGLQALAPPPVTEGQPRRLLDERGPGASPFTTAEPADP